MMFTTYSDKEAHNGTLALDEIESWKGESTPTVTLRIAESNYKVSIL